MPTDEGRVRFGDQDLLTPAMAGAQTRIKWGEVQWGGSDAVVSVLQQLVGQVEKVDSWGNRTHVVPVKIEAPNLLELAAREAALTAEVAKGYNTLEVTPPGGVAPTSVWRVMWSQLEPGWDYLAELRFTRYYRLSFRVLPYAFSPESVDLPASWVLQANISYGSLPGVGSAPTGLSGLLTAAAPTSALGDTLVYTRRLSGWDPPLLTNASGTPTASTWSGVASPLDGAGQTLNLTAPLIEGSHDLILRVRATAAVSDSLITVTVDQTFPDGLPSASTTHTVPTGPMAAGVWRVMTAGQIHKPLSSREGMGTVTLTIKGAGLEYDHGFIVPTDGELSLLSVAGTRLVLSPGVGVEAAMAYQHSSATNPRSKGVAVAGSQGHVAHPEGTHLLIASVAGHASLDWWVTPAWHTHAGLVEV